MQGSWEGDQEKKGEKTRTWHFDNWPKWLWCANLEKKKTSPIYILISYLFHCFNPPLLGIQHPGLCVWEGRGGQACSLSLERKEKWEKGKGKWEKGMLWSWQWHPLVLICSWSYPEPEWGLELLSLLGWEGTKLALKPGGSRWKGQ